MKDRTGEPEQNNGSKDDHQVGPEFIQFQVPTQQPQPILQMPIQSQPINQAGQQPPKRLEGVENLVESIRETTKEGNNSEAQVPSQIIIISSAILAGIGVFVLNPNQEGGHLPWPIIALLLIAVLGLGTSLIAGVFHYASERQFWYKTRERAMFAMNILAAIANPADRNNAAIQATNLLDGGSNRTAFWIQLISFIVGASALIILILSILISKL